jgi:hypothetical protein
MINQLTYMLTLDHIADLHREADRERLALAADRRRGRGVVRRGSLLWGSKRSSNASRTPPAPNTARSPTAATPPAATRTQSPAA